MNSNINSENVGGASMEEIERQTSSRAHSCKYYASWKERKHNKTKQLIFCDAINNVAQVTREQNLVAREKNKAKRKYSFEKSMEIFSGMEVHGATDVKSINFLSEPKMVHYIFCDEWGTEEVLARDPQVSVSRCLSRSLGCLWTNLLD